MPGLSHHWVLYFSFRNSWVDGCQGQEVISGHTGFSWAWEFREGWLGAMEPDRTHMGIQLQGSQPGWSEEEGPGARGARVERGPGSGGEEGLVHEGTRMEKQAQVCGAGPVHEGPGGREAPVGC